MFRRGCDGLADTRRWLLIVFLIGLIHAGAYALAVPPWQAPDEPGHFEAACLLGELQRPLTGDDLSPGLQRQILANLARHDFWTRVRTPWPTPLPLSFETDPFLTRSGRQAGDEPPLYYLLPALICRAALPIEARMRWIRLFGALLFGFTGVVAAWGGGIGRQLVSLLPLLLVLLPMPAFIAGSVNNDALAMLTATAVFAAVLRIQRLGWTWRRGVGLLMLVVLASVSKKTNSFLLPWVTILGLAAGWQWLKPHGWQRETAVKILFGAAVVLVVLLLPLSSPASWSTAGLPWVVRRLDSAGPASPGAPDHPAVVTIDRLRRGVIQTVAGRTMRALRGQIVYASVWVRSPDDRPTAGRLIVRDAAGPSEVEFVAGDQWQSVAISHTVAVTATRIKVAVMVGDGDGEMGGLLLSHAVLFPRTEAGSAANLLRNGDFSRSARLGELLLVAPLKERWQRFAPRKQAGVESTGAVLTRYGLYSLLTFAGFWGNFGWLQRPLSLWMYAVLVVVCLLAAVGVIRCLCRPQLISSGVPRTSLLSWLLAVLLIVAQAFLPMLGRAWQPQGRYLFPALLPITGLLMVGLDAWLDFTVRPQRWILLLGALIAFDLVCLLRAAFVI